MNISAVIQINFNVPRVPEDYIHRVGRTARSGRGGLALTLVSQYEIELFKVRINEWGGGNGCC